jgi:hypothetical protein
MEKLYKYKIKDLTSGEQYELIQKEKINDYDLIKKLHYLLNNESNNYFLDEELERLKERCLDLSNQMNAELSALKPKKEKIEGTREELIKYNIVFQDKARNYQKNIRPVIVNEYTEKLKEFIEILKNKEEIKQKLSDYNLPDITHYSNIIKIIQNNLNNNIDYLNYKIKCVICFDLT